MATIAPITNGESGLSVRNKINLLIDQYNITAGVGVSNLLLEDGTLLMADEVPPPDQVEDKAA
jgi:hypothetical protein